MPRTAAPMDDTSIEALLLNDARIKVYEGLDGNDMSLMKDSEIADFYRPVFDENPTMTCVVRRIEDGRHETVKSPEDVSKAAGFAGIYGLYVMFPRDWEDIKARLPDRDRSGVEIWTLTPEKEKAASP